MELLLLIVNWVIVAIQAFTIFVSGGNWILFIVMLCAVAGQAISTVIHRRKMRKDNKN